MEMEGATGLPSITTLSSSFSHDEKVANNPIKTKYMNDILRMVQRLRINNQGFE
jgi:hypothetical protein